MADLSTILIDGKTGLVSFGWLPNGPVKLRGIFSLVQLAVYAILRLTGKDSFRPDFGTIFLTLPGTATINFMDDLRADIAIIIKSAETNVLNDQKAYNNLTADDTLASLTLLSVTQDTTDPTIINIRVEVRNRSGQVFNFGIPAIRA